MAGDKSQGVFRVVALLLPDGFVDEARCIVQRSKTLEIEIDRIKGRGYTLPIQALSNLSPKAPPSL